MMVAILDFPVKEGELDEAVRVLRGGLAATRAFAGNLGAEILLDGDPRHFLLLETWESAAHNDGYQSWRLTPDGVLPGFAEHLRGPFVMTEYTVAEH
ncbi:MAG: antibiotic biosynthesis monooxygenase family protein [Pseudolysinimonas sp.]